jgi:hypothetical protein
MLAILPLSVVVLTIIIMAALMDQDKECQVGSFDARNFLILKGLVSLAFLASRVVVLALAVREFRESKRNRKELLNQIAKGTAPARGAALARQTVGGTMVWGWQSGRSFSWPPRCSRPAFGARLCWITAIFTRAISSRGTPTPCPTRTAPRWRACGSRSGGRRGLERGPRTGTEG